MAPIPNEFESLLKTENYEAYHKIGNPTFVVSSNRTTENSDDDSVNARMIMMNEDANKASLSH